MHIYTNISIDSFYVGPHCMDHVDIFFMRFHCLLAISSAQHLFLTHFVIMFYVVMFLFSHRHKQRTNEFVYWLAGCFHFLQLLTIKMIKERKKLMKRVIKKLKADSKKYLHYIAYNPACVPPPPSSSSSNHISHLASHHNFTLTRLC